MSLDAHYFDGHSSRRHPVRLTALDGALRIEGEDGAHTIPAADIRASEPQGSAPRTLRFAGNRAFCEIAQGRELDALLAALGQRDSIVVRLQGRWRWVFVSLGVVAMVLCAAYFWGLPWGAKVIAPHIPITAMRSISEQALAQLDNFLFYPGRLPPDRQQKLRDGFRALVVDDPELAAYGDRITLVFRSAPKIGPNAFALPGGQVVILDELVQMPGSNDEEILAVLAHELGHLACRHGIRQLIQSSALAAFSAAWFGDISAAVAGLSTMLLNSAYSRDMEREADGYAAATLRRQGKSPALLASALEKLEAFHSAKKRLRDEEGANDEAGKFLDWISSHPDTAERIQHLRAAP
ncbi:MAG: M48 family metallopeptidase [Azoarcus sp.]|jgi:Zn-dependent protease with chaperone function|nr:M48 family metallopeptidase [Azoarcus sp.]